GNGPGGLDDLDEIFDKSLGDFEDVISEEQETVGQVERDTSTVGGDGSAGGSGGGVVVANRGGKGAGSGSGSGGGGEKGGTISGSADRGVPTIQTIPDDVIKERTPDDIPSATSDDVVARQLREAAQAEEDPLIRERLWDEYRNYMGLKKR
ncbi:MAG: hypothetical protein AAFU66_10250, partial [Pseudomonadota bacterium]